MPRNTLALSAAFCFISALAHAQSAQTFADNRVINCTLKPIQVIEISSQLTGVAEQVFVRPGQLVEKGMPILKLDTDIVRADLKLARERAAMSAPLDVAKVRAAALEQRFGRIEKAYKRKATSAVEYEDARLDYDLAVADIAVQEQQLTLLSQQADRVELTIAKSTIFSPTQGVIGEGIIHVGEQVGTTPVATLFVVDELRAEAFVPLNQLSKIRTLDSFELIIDGNAEAPVSGSLDYISPVANLASNTISVYFSVKDQNVISQSRCELKL